MTRLSIQQFKLAEGAFRFKERITLFLKLFFVVALLYFLVNRGFISIQATQEALKQWRKIVPALLAIFCSTLMGVTRWQWLLQAQNIHLKWTRIFQLTLIGNFFNIALPGAVSGDFVKAFYVGKEVKGQRTRAFGSILFDRVAGVSALVLVSAGALALGFRTYAHSSLLGAIQTLIEVAAGCVLVFYIYLFFVNERHDPLLRFFRIAEKKFVRARSLTGIYESLRHYHRHRLTVIKVLALSILIHLMVGWSCLKYGEALGSFDLSLLSVYVIVPLGLLVTAIPVAPAGVGTGNIAFFYFFHLIGSERGADIFSLFALTNIFMGALGGIVYFRFKSEVQETLDFESLSSSPLE